MKLDVLYEDNHLLVVNKPAGLATMGDGDRTTLHSLAGRTSSKNIGSRTASTSVSSAAWIPSSPA